MKQKLFEKKRLFCSTCQKRSIHKVELHGNNSWLRCNICKKLSHIKVLLILCLFLLVSCKKPIPDSPTEITFRLNPYSIVNYTIEFNHTLLKSGVLEPTWNDIRVLNQAGEYEIYFWNNDYYVDLQIENSYNTKNNVTITRELKLKQENKKGILNITLNPNIANNRNQKIDLIFEANGTVKHLIYCIYRTIGIMDVKPENNIIYCSTNYWTNVTKYGNLSDSLYFCEDMVMKCKSTESTQCESNMILIPTNLKVDDCYFTGKTLRNNKLVIRLNVDTIEYYNEGDFIKVYAFDMDLMPKKRVLDKAWAFDIKDMVKEQELR